MDLKFVAEICDPNNSTLLGFSTTKFEESVFDSKGCWTKTGNKQINFELGFLLFKVKLVYTYNTIN